MTQAYVVDASVAVKWLLEEEFSERAQALLEDCRYSLRPLFGPPHLPGEVTNAILQQVRRNSITEEEAVQVLDGFLRQSPVQLLNPPGLYQRAFAFARSNALSSVYDSLYVTLAQMVDAELWTDDRRLLNSVTTAAPWVRWIGDYPETV